MSPTHVSCFSGCGGFTAGLKAAGWDTVLALDLDPACLTSHRLNHPEAATFLADAGYRNRLAGVLDAAEHGVPQARRRWLALATRHDGVRLRWPGPVTAGRPVTGREAFAGLPSEPGDSYAEGRSGYADLMGDY